MANDQNLLKPEDLTPTQRRENASKAGKASAEARKKRKMLRECLEVLLGGENATVLDEHGNPMTGAEIMAVAAFRGAVAGDWKAWELVRDTAGQKPVGQVEITEPIRIIDDV